MSKPALPAPKYLHSAEIPAWQNPAIKITASQGAVVQDVYWYAQAAAEGGKVTHGRVSGPFAGECVGGKTRLDCLRHAIGYALSIGLDVRELARGTVADQKFSAAKLMNMILRFAAERGIDARTGEPVDQDCPTCGKVHNGWRVVCGKCRVESLSVVNEPEPKNAAEARAACTHEITVTDGTLQRTEREPKPAPLPIKVDKPATPAMRAAILAAMSEPGYSVITADARTLRGMCDRGYATRRGSSSVGTLTLEGCTAGRLFLAQNTPASEGGTLPEGERAPDHRRAGAA